MSGKAARVPLTETMYEMLQRWPIVARQKRKPTSARGRGGKLAKLRAL